MMAKSPSKHVCLWIMPPKNIRLDPQICMARLWTSLCTIQQKSMTSSPLHSAYRATWHDFPYLSLGRVQGIRNLIYEDPTSPGSDKWEETGYPLPVPSLPHHPVQIQPFGRFFSPTRVRYSVSRVRHSILSIRIWSKKGASQYTTLSFEPILSSLHHLLHPLIWRMTG
jgi:hypothetical protein